MTEVKKAISKKNYASALIHLMAVPIEWLIGKINIVKTRHKKIFSILFGIIVLLSGAALALIEQHYVPKFAWDGVCYGIHGIGLAPIAKVFFDFIEIEI
jgi:hypothetical protein